MITIERCYTILGVQPGAPPDEVKRAYRDLVREWHPDRLQHDARKQKQAEERLKEINIAYDRIQTYVAEGPSVAATAPRPQRPRPARTPNGYTRTSAYRAYSGEEEPETTGESSYNRSVTLNDEGMTHFRSGRLREAVSALMQSVCLQPNNAEAHLTLGISYRLLNLPAKAASAFKQVIRFRPDSSEAHNNLGQAYIEMGELKEAVWVCAQYLRRRPEGAEVYITLGSAYRRQGRLPQAMEALKEAVKLQPGSAEAHYEVGLTHVSGGDKDLAREEYETLRGLNQDLSVKLLLAILDR
jgi:Flp pilus assembly protein TadD